MAKHISLLLYIAIAVVAKLPNTHAQVHYLQFEAMPMSANPAFAGMFDGTVRVSALYRNQWGAVTVPFVTYGTSFDLPLLRRKLNSYWGVGGQVLETAGGDGNMKNRSGIVSLAYHRYISKKEYGKSEFGIGIQGTYSQNTFDVSDVFFNNFPNGVFQPLSINTTPNAYSFYKLNAGISFSQTIGRHLKLLEGVAVNNINEPTSDILKRREAGRGVARNAAGIIQAQLSVGHFMVKPVVSCFAGEHFTNLIAGGDFYYRVKRGHLKQPALFLGIWYRSRDITAITTGVEFGSLRASIAYDYTLSSPSSVYGNGGYEIAIRYIARGGVKR